MRESVLGEVAGEDVSLVLFAFLEHYPFSAVLSLIAILLLIIFFVTSADSATVVLGSLTSGGSPFYSDIQEGDLGFVPLRCCHHPVAHGRAQRSSDDGDHSGLSVYDCDDPVVLYALRWAVAGKSVEVRSLRTQLGIYLMIVKYLSR